MDNKLTPDQERTWLLLKGDYARITLDKCDEISNCRGVKNGGKRVHTMADQFLNSVVATFPHEELLRAAKTMLKMFPRLEPHKLPNFDSLHRAIGPLKSGGSHIQVYRRENG